MITSTGANPSSESLFEAERTEPRQRKEGFPQETTRIQGTDFEIVRPSRRSQKGGIRTEEKTGHPITTRSEESRTEEIYGRGESYTLRLA